MYRDWNTSKSHGWGICSIPIVGQTLPQWGDAIDAWAVWITYTCKMSWYILYQHPRWNQVLYECVSQAIWSSMRGYNIYILYTCTYYWYVCVCEYVWLFERIGRLNRRVFTNNIQRYAGYVYQHCGQRTASICFLIYPGLLLHIASKSYHPVSFRDDFCPSLRDGRWRGFSRGGFQNLPWGPSEPDLWG